MKRIIIALLVLALIAATLNSIFACGAYDTQGYKGYSCLIGDDIVIGLEYQGQPGLFVCDGENESLIGNWFETGC